MPGQRFEGAGHAKVHVHDDRVGPVPKEVEQVLAVHLNAAERALVDGLCACSAACK